MKNKNLIIYPSVDENIKHQIIKKCLFLILTSNNRAEGYGLVLIEAQMNKKPAIVFKIGTGVNEIIKHKYNGYEIKNNNIEEFSKYTNFLYDKKNIKILNKLKKNSYYNYNRYYNLNAFKPLHNQIWKKFMIFLLIILSIAN